MTKAYAPSGNRTRDICLEGRYFTTKLRVRWSRATTCYNQQQYCVLHIVLSASGDGLLANHFSWQWKNCQTRRKIIFLHKVQIDIGSARTTTDSKQRTKYTSCVLTSFRVNTLWCPGIRAKQTATVNIWCIIDNSMLSCFIPCKQDLWIR